MIIKKGRVGQSYCIGGNNSISSKLLAEELVEKLCVDKDLIKYTRDRKGHDRKYAVDTQKITSELDWTPQTTFHTGLEKTIEWYKCNADWWENLWPEAQKLQRNISPNKNCSVEIEFPVWQMIIDSRYVSIGQWHYYDNVACIYRSSDENVHMSEALLFI